MVISSRVVLKPVVITVSSASFSLSHGTRITRRVCNEEAIAPLCQLVAFIVQTDKAQLDRGPTASKTNYCASSYT